MRDPLRNVRTIRTINSLVLLRGQVAARSGYRTFVQPTARLRMAQWQPARPNGFGEVPPPPTTVSCRRKRCPLKSRSAAKALKQPSCGQQLKIYIRYVKHNVARKQQEHVYATKSVRTTTTSERETLKQTSLRLANASNEERVGMRGRTGVLPIPCGAKRNRKRRSSNSTSKSQ